MNSELLIPVGAITTAARRRSLIIACVAHVLHDGYTDLLHVLFPLWQIKFSLGYEALAMARTLYAAERELKWRVLGPLLSAKPAALGARATAVARRGR